MAWRGPVDQDGRKWPTTGTGLHSSRTAGYRIVLGNDKKIFDSWWASSDVPGAQEVRGWRLAGGRGVDPVAWRSRHLQLRRLGGLRTPAGASRFDAAWLASRAEGLGGHLVEPSAPGTAKPKPHWPVAGPRVEVLAGTGPGESTPGCPPRRLSASTCAELRDLASSVESATFDLTSAVRGLGGLADVPGHARASWAAVYFVPLRSKAPPTCGALAPAGRSPRLEMADRFKVTDAPQASTSPATSPLFQP